MPPRIRSITPDSEEYDQLESPPPAAVRPHPLPIHLTVTGAHASASRATSASVQQPTSGDDEDEDDLSSLEDSDDGAERGRQQQALYAQMERDDEEDERAQATRAYTDDDEEKDQLDDDDDFAPTSKKGRPTPRAAPKAATASNTGGMKIKFKLGGAAAATPQSASSVAGSSRAGSVKGSTTKGGKKGKGKSKRYEDDEDNFDESDEFDSDASGSSSVGSGSGQRLTARQRAKEMGGEFGMELQSLPNKQAYHGPPIPKLTEAELALKKAENSRKRKHQSDKKLEDEKTETINRLLKKQVSKQSGKGGKGNRASKLSQSTNNHSAGGGGDDGDSAPSAAFYVPPLVPVMSRWVSSTKSGEYSCVVGLPVGRRELGVLGERDAPMPKEPVYPGPRPPLKTRRLGLGLDF